MSVVQMAIATRAFWGIPFTAHYPFPLQLPPSAVFRLSKPEQITLEPETAGFLHHRDAISGPEMQMFLFTLK
jgi:hypothetical protein